MSIDGFTAGLMLGAIKRGGGDEIADLYKSLNSNKDGGPTPEARAFFEEHKGKNCKIKHTTHEATIHELNEATSGFYPGSRAPIFVKITSAESIGSVFEYDLDQIEIVE